MKVKSWPHWALQIITGKEKLDRDDFLISYQYSDNLGGHKLKFVQESNSMKYQQIFQPLSDV